MTGPLVSRWCRWWRSSRRWRFATLVLAVLAAGSCEEVSVTSLSVSSVEVIPADATLPVGEGLELEAVARGGDGTPVSGRSTEWSVEDRTVAIVDSRGLVIGISGGRTVVEARVDGVVGEASIRVVPRDGTGEDDGDDEGDDAEDEDEPEDDPDDEPEDDEPDEDGDEGDEDDEDPDDDPDEDDDEEDDGDEGDGADDDEEGDDEDDGEDEDEDDEEEEEEEEDEGDDDDPGSGGGNGNGGR